MRYIMCLMMLLGCALGALAYNEVIPAIAYNPSRAGAYQKLIAVQNATFREGIETTDPVIVNVLSKEGTTVSLQDKQTNHKCTKESCKQANINTIENIRSEGAVTVTGSSVMQKYTDSSTVAPFLGMYSFDDDASQPKEDNGTKVNVFGGTFTATRDSYIQSFPNTTVDRLKAKANELRVTGDLHAQTSFTLGNIKVSADGAQECGGPSQKKCEEYAWVERAGHTVLAVKVK